MSEICDLAIGDHVLIRLPHWENRQRSIAVTVTHIEQFGFISVRTDKTGYIFGFDCTGKGPNGQEWKLDHDNNKAT